MCTVVTLHEGLFTCSNISGRVVSISVNTFIPWELGQARVHLLILSLLSRKTGLLNGVRVRTHEKNA